MSVDFDDYGDSYERELRDAIAFAGQAPDFFAEGKARILLELIESTLGPTEEVRALDVGCGSGGMHRHLAARIGRLEGIDVSMRLVEAARESNPSVHYHTYSGETLPLADNSFDAAFAVCVLHHVEPSGWRRFAGEIARVVRPGGLVAVFEHNPVNPLTRLVVHRCAFDEDVTLLGRRKLAGLLAETGISTDARYFFFFPWRSSVLTRIEKRIGRLPIGAQYVVYGRRTAR